jgi:spore coat polysaccharide biosynthesis predicted glycosyltransferase SpsG/ribosomal protein S18 acetylase RimI-like enzyme
MRVLLRCDASVGSGVGHLVRCLALAEAARARGWDPAVLGTVEAPLGRRLVAASGVPVLPIGPGHRAGGLDRAAVRALDADVLHVDHYGIAGDLRVAGGPLLSSAEDGPFGRRPADVVVDPTLGAQDAPRPDDGSPTVLLGVRYAPLRASVRAARRVALAAAGSGADDVLVVMGGTDAFDVGAAAARVAERAGAARVRVVAGEDAAARVRAAAPDAELLGPQDDLPALAATSGVVLSAAGTSVWELACVGAPAALVAVTENQRTGYQRAVRAGVAVGLGPLEAVRAAAPGPVAVLRDLLASPERRRELADAGRALVDGLGADRVLDAWWAASGRPVLAARPAGGTDAGMLLAWRNDPATRASSRSQDAVPPEVHLRWLDAVLADRDRLLLVVERTGRAVGTVRFDRLDDSRWEVSITLAPDARGRGLAADVLATAERAWRAVAGHRPSVLAYVRPGNTASARLFEGAGYRRRADPAGTGLDTFVKPGA